MSTSEIELDLPAIRALGARFKLTEVFLRDNGCSSDNRQASSFPKHIRFKYDSDDDENIDANNGEISSNTCLETMEDCIVTEHDDLTQQMNALGLPICFQTSKQRSGKTKKKSKATQHKNQEDQKSFEDQVQESCRMSKESLFHADFPDKSCYSSSLSLPDQTEVSCSGSDGSDEITRCTTSSNGDKPADLLFHETELQMETEMLSRSYIIDNGLEQSQKETEISLTEQVNLAGSGLCSSVMQPEDLGSGNTTEQTQVTDLSNGSQNMVLDAHDDNAKCNEFQDENIICYGTSGDWSAFWDSFYMRYYFYNAKTHESTWDPPPGMENFDFGDIPCISSKSNAEMPGINLDPATPRCEEENIDGYELVEKTGSDDRRVDAIKGSLEHIADDWSTPLAVLSDNTCVVNTSDLHALDGNCQDEISLVTSLDIGEHTYLEDVEMKANDLSMQDIPAGAKRKKTRKNRTRKKSSRDNEGYELQPAEEFYVDLTKYWCQRYLLFSRFDFGVKMDEEGWFSVTPEAIARHQASRSGGGIIIDCFAGVGGNAIQFARVGTHVIAIDIDPNKIDYAHHNAAIYGVEDRIDFINGDSLSIGPKLKADSVFLSPPWGGPDYAKVDSYDINMLQPYDGQLLFNTFKAIASMIIMFLPRNVNLVQLAELALSTNSEWSLEVEKNFLNGKLKAVTAYFSKTSEQDG